MFTQYKKDYTNFKLNFDKIHLNSAFILLERFFSPSVTLSYFKIVINLLDMNALSFL